MRAGLVGRPGVVSLTPNTVELIPALGALVPRGGLVQDPVRTVCTALHVHTPIGPSDFLTPTKGGHCNLFCRKALRFYFFSLFFFSIRLFNVLKEFLYGIPIHILTYRIDWFLRVSEAPPSRGRAGQKHRLG